jgi:hypothetical protein
MSASIIRIKRSGTSGAPSALAQGELAYSFAGVAGGQRLYVGTGAVDPETGLAASVDVIGGKYFTDLLDHTHGQLTASSAIITDGNGKIDELRVDSVNINGNVITTEAESNSNLVLNADGTGLVSLYGKYTMPDATPATGNILVATESGALVFAPPAASSFTITGENDTTATFNTAETLTFVGSGDSVNITVAKDGTVTTVTADVVDASATVKGLASFNADSFSVTDGAVSIKAAGVTNAQLVNDSITIGTTEIDLGASSTTLAGLTSVAIGNLSISGNTISSTDTDGNIVLDPNGTGVVNVSGAVVTGLANVEYDTDAVGYDGTAAVNAATLATAIDELDGAMNLTVGGDSASSAVVNLRDDSLRIVSGSNAGIGVVVARGTEVGVNDDQVTFTVALDQDLSTSGTPTFAGLTLTGDLVTSQTTISAFNTTATTINLGGAATTINVGSGASGATTNFAGDVTVSGDLVVNGTTTTINVETLTVKDPLIKFAQDNPADTLDIGFYGEYKSGEDVLKTGLFRDATNKEYYLFEQLQADLSGNVVPTASLELSVINAKTFKGEFEGVIDGGTY